MAEEHFMAEFTRHQRTLYGYIRSLCPRLQDADEVFSQTSMALWRKSSQYEPGTNFVAWACRMAEFEVLNYLRTQRRDRLVFDEQLLTTLAHETAEYLAGNDRRAAALRDCLDQLPENHRRMIVTRYESQDPVGRIAESFGRSAASFSVTLHKIRKQLLACIRGRANGETS
ncbi:sigma-70 family RNA polymerase sigma factor [Planctomycetales bacterium ZRK34]|nr:sigma-70 family RNA polymerase sigma factor [Planctomycetales bacterium ZRK34]